MSLSTPIVQIIDLDPVAVDIEQRISEAVRLLSSERFHHLPVVDGRRLVGLLSATDILELKHAAPIEGESDYAAAAELDKHYRVEDVMQRDLVTITHQATVGDAARMLSAGGFHSLPVVDEKSQLVGIVTTTDLIGHMLAAPTSSGVPAAVRRRLDLLEKVLSAAQHYLRSGMGAQEHARLEQAVEAARSARPPT